VTPYATHLPGIGDTALDSVPGTFGPTAQPVPATGPMGHALLAALLVSVGLSRFATTSVGSVTSPSANRSA
jgi:hypothetical protein